jgi:hypothetical protein
MVFHELTHTDNSTTNYGYEEGILHSPRMHLPSLIIILAHFSWIVMNLGVAGHQFTG